MQSTSDKLTDFLIFKLSSKTHTDFFFRDNCFGGPWDHTIDVKAFTKFIGGKSNNFIVYQKLYI